MRIVINHVTRMTPPRICVAGIDEQRRRHVRPTTARESPITQSMLMSHGGMLGLGVLVELGDAHAQPAAPEVEDHRCSTADIKLVRRLLPEEYLDLVWGVSHGDLHTIFGQDLERRRRSYAVEVGRGSASLGVLRGQETPDLAVDRFGKLRLLLDDGASIGVTDARFFAADQRTVRRGVVEDVRSRMRQGVDHLLMVGLARAFLAAGDDRERHWLQINGVCMIDRPLDDDA